MAHPSAEHLDSPAPDPSMTSPTLRIWAEHLPLTDLQSPALLRLLARHKIHPIAALRPTSDLDSAARYLRSARDHDLQPGIWPLLSSEHGYWPSAANLPTFAAHTRTLIDELAARQASPALIAVDLEPPLATLRRLHTLIRPSLTNLRTSSTSSSPPRASNFDHASTLLNTLVTDLHLRDIATLGITLPTAAHDLRDGHDLWQRTARTPWMHIDWQLAGIMTYGSMLAGYSRGLLSTEDARYIHWRLLRHLRRHFGPRSHASIGVTGAGILGDEPSYNSPLELTLDLSATLHAGIQDVAIFCLEGILNRPHPERWLQALTHATPARPPSTPRTRALQALAASTRALLLKTIPR